MRSQVLVMCILVTLVALVCYRVYVVLHRTMPIGLAEGEKVRWLDELGRIANGGSILMHDMGVEPGMEPLKIFINTAFSLIFNPSPLQRAVYRDVRVSQDVYDGIPVSTYTPARPKTTSHGYPTIIYLHGGGWTWLSVGVYDGHLKHFANTTKFKIVAVEYRKAPQHPFPAAYDDCLAVTRYIIQHARELNIWKDNVIVAGDGAGGNLAAAVANQMPGLIRLQILITPALQMVNFATPSYQEYSDHLIPGLTSAEKEIHNWMRYGDIDPEMTQQLQRNVHVSLEHYSFLSHYVDSRVRFSPELNVTDKHTIHNSACDEKVSAVLDRFVLDSRFNPMLTPDVRSVADAYIIASQHDVLRDDALMYSHRLRESGVGVELKHYWNGFHGFFIFAGGGWIELEESKKAMNELGSYLRTEVLLELPDD